MGESHIVILQQPKIPFLMENSVFLIRFEKYTSSFQHFHLKGNNNKIIVLFI